MELKQCPDCYKPPLTLEELRKMDGEPVWIDISSSRSCWAIVKNYDEQHNMIKFSGVGGLSCDIYGKYWLAWRHRPEENANAAT